MYREKIRQLGSAALARHGTDVSAWRGAGTGGRECWEPWLIGTLAFAAVD